MSRLYFTERGHVIPTLCEELTTFRRARKRLRLPSTASDATLYFLARPHAGSGRPLRVSVNGTELPPIAPGSRDAYLWYPAPVPVACLQPEANVLELWCDATAMNGWSLAMEAGHRDPESFVTDDGGRSWRNEGMGFLSVLRGEYVVRVRLAEGEDPPPPAMVWEDPTHPRLAALRQLIPPEALRPGRRLDQIRALTGWLSAAWEHTSSARAALYAPWDAETIVAWGAARRGHAGQVPIVMCVHYGAAFVSCCQAAGIPARCAAIWGNMNGWNGHFVAEVWLDEFRKWVMVDPNLDAILWRDGVPLSITEIQQAGDDLRGLVERGPGFAVQLENPHLVPWVEETYYSGVCFRHRSLWHRADLLSRPDLSPPGHGSTSYCETGFVWETRDRERGFGMFPSFGDAAYFDAAPQPKPG